MFNAAARPGYESERSTAWFLKPCSSYVAICAGREGSRGVDVRGACAHSALVLSSIASSATVSLGMGSC